SLEDPRDDDGPSGRRSGRHVVEGFARKLPDDLAGVPERMLLDGWVQEDARLNRRSRFTYQHVRKRAVREPAKAQEHEHLPRWLDDHPLTVALFQHPDQRSESRGVHEGDTREVDQ